MKGIAEHPVMVLGIHSIKKLQVDKWKKDAYSRSFAGLEAATWTPLRRDAESSQICGKHCIRPNKLRLQETVAVDPGGIAEQFRDLCLKDT